MGQNSNGFNFIAANTSAMALIQYLPSQTFTSMQNDRLSVAISLLTTSSTEVGTVNLYYTTGAVPVLPLSPIVSISADPIPVLTLTGGWTPIPRTLGVATFTATPTEQQFLFSGWDPTGLAPNVAYQFAIVITFAAITAAHTVAIRYCSLNSGDVPTRPAPQTLDEVLRECQYYYQKSFLTATVPDTNVGVNTGETYFVQSTTGGSIGFIPVRFPSAMRATPVNPPVFYNPVAADALIRNLSTGVSYTNTALTANTLTANGFVVSGNSDAGIGAGAGNLLAIHWTADSRLGVI